MNNIKLIQASCADQNVDAVVNAANGSLAEGGGICGELFKRAGRRKLADACRQYRTPLTDGSAVITPAFDMPNAKYIIHAVGPDFRFTPGAFKELFYAYYNSLDVLVKNGLHSISFPLISSSIFAGNTPHPSGESVKQCFRAYRSFINDHPDCDIDVTVCVYSRSSMAEADSAFKDALKKAASSVLTSSEADIDGCQVIKDLGPVSCGGSDTVSRSLGFGFNYWGSMALGVAGSRNAALDNLKEAACRLGANAIIHVKYEDGSAEPETEAAISGEVEKPYAVSSTASGIAVLVGNFQR